VHHHFGSKEGLWREAMAAVFSNVGRLAVVPADVSPPDRLVTVAEQFVRFVAEHPEVTRIIAREGAAPSQRLTYLVDRYLREPFQQVVAAVRAGQRAGLITADVRADLVLFALLGAGSHLFDVTALARQSLGIEATAARTREEFVALVRMLLAHGLFRTTGAPRRTREHP
jgi:AcrR family transcriptional regulator